MKLGRKRETKKGRKKKKRGNKIRNERMRVFLKTLPLLLRSSTFGEDNEKNKDKKRQQTRKEKWEE